MCERVSVYKCKAKRVFKMPVRRNLLLGSNLPAKHLLSGDIDTFIEKYTAFYANLY